MGWHGVVGGAGAALAGRDKAHLLAAAAVSAEVAVEGAPADVMADGGEGALCAGARGLVV